jgi:hypothetical protein
MSYRWPENSITLPVEGDRFFASSVNDMQVSWNAFNGIVLPFVVQSQSTPFLRYLTNNIINIIVSRYNRGASPSTYSDDTLVNAVWALGGPMSVKEILRRRGMSSTDRIAFLGLLSEPIKTTGREFVERYLGEDKADEGKADEGDAPTPSGTSVPVPVPAPAPTGGVPPPSPSTGSPVNDTSASGSGGAEAPSSTPTGATPTPTPSSTPTGATPTPTPSSTPTGAPPPTTPTPTPQAGGGFFSGWNGLAADSTPYSENFKEKREQDKSVRANLRVFLPIAGDDSIEEQGDDESMYLKAQNLMMGQYKPSNWPLGNVDNPFWLGNQANTGIRFSGQLNEMPAVMSGGTLTEGAKLYGSYRRRPTDPMDILPPPYQPGKRKFR